MQAPSGAPRKPRSWKDIQLIVSSISMAVTLGLWGLLASREKGVAAVGGEVGLPPIPPTPTLEAEPMLLPGQTLYLMTPPAQTTAPAADQERRERREKEKKGGGGGGHAATGSS
jgi:hypothetical protein